MKLFWQWGVVAHTDYEYSNQTNRNQSLKMENVVEKEKKKRKPTYHTQ